MAKKRKHPAKDKKSTNTNSPKSNSPLSSLKWVLLVGVLAVGGYFLYSSMGNAKVPTDTSSVFTLLPTGYTGVDFVNKVREEPERGLHFYDYFIMAQV